MAKPWRWLGSDWDGGMWIRPVPENGYADVVRVTPCSDAGGHDNHYWVECLTVYGMDEEDKRADVLSVSGISARGTGKPDALYALAEAFVWYGYYDPANCYPDHHSETVQLGTKPGGQGFGPVKTTVKLRANANIKRYARRLAWERM